MSENNEKELNSNPTDNDDSKSERQIISPLEALGLFESINQRFSDQSKYYELKNDTRLKEIENDYKTKYEEDRKWLSTVKKVIKWAALVVLFLGLSGIAWFFVFINNQIENIKTQVDSQVENVNVEVDTTLNLLDENISQMMGEFKDEFSIQIDSIKSITNDQVDSVRIKVSEKINDEFKTSRITSLIDEHARQYVEKESKSYIHEQVNNTFDPFRLEMKSIIDSANSNLVELADMIEVYNLADGAASGSKKAYFKLRELAKREGNIGVTSRNRMSILNNSFSDLTFIPLIASYLEFRKDTVWVSPDSFSVDELIDYMYKEGNRSDYLLQVSGMGSIMKRPKEEILRKSIEVFRDPDSPLTTNIAFSSTINQILKLVKNNLEFDLYDFEAIAEKCEEELKNMEEGNQK